LKHQSKEGEKVDDIIEDVLQLRDDLANVSKQVFARRLSKVFAKTKTRSIKTFFVLYDVLTKEVMKQVLIKGAIQISKWLNDAYSFMLYLGQ